MKTKLNLFCVCVLKMCIRDSSTAFLEETGENKKPSGVGNPTEIALLLWLNEQGKNYLELRENAKVINQLTFSTERKYMATLVDSPIQQKKVLYIKGCLLYTSRCV